MTDKHTPARPFVWNVEQDWRTNLEQIETINDSLNEHLLRVLAIKEERAIVDEYALLLPGRDMVGEFIDDAVGNGWTYFNRASDIVRAEPFGTVYPVTYHFLSHPSYPWRFEVMVKGKGISPVHDALREALNGFPLVHASFKALTVFNYEVCREALAGAGYVRAQECASTYGAFGYWRRPADDRVLYVKPRVNLRDSNPGEPVSISEHFAAPKDATSYAAFGGDRVQGSRVFGDVR